MMKQLNANHVRAIKYMIIVTKNDLKSIIESLGLSHEKKNKRFEDLHLKRLAEIEELEKLFENAYQGVLSDE